MHFRDKMAPLLLLCLLFAPGESLLFPLLFPLSIKITFHSNAKPPPPPETSYHFEAVPGYSGITVKGQAHISTVPKYSYGDGSKYGTSYGDGHSKVYTEEPHIIRGHNYGTGYSSGGGSIDGHITISSNPVPPTIHFKGTTYDNTGSNYKGAVSFPQTHYKGSSNDGTHYKVPQSHYKGTTYAEVPQTDYKGTTYKEVPQTHYKGTDYVEVPETHYKGTTYEKVPQTHYEGTTYEKVPQTHYKGTTYDDVPQTHYKGTSEGTHYKGTTYDDVPQTHYKGTVYEDVPSHYKGSTGSSKPKHVYNDHSYIKSVAGYKLTDYISDDKTTKYPDDTEYIAISPGKSYAEIEAAHKAGHRPKAYSAEEYADLGSRKYNKKEYEHDSSYIDDTLPEYKENIPKPRYRANTPRSRYRVPYQASSSRYDRVLPEASENKVYAGFGTSIYGDSYAKIVYVPKSLKISIRAYSRQ